MDVYNKEIFDLSQLTDEELEDLGKRQYQLEKAPVPPEYEEDAKEFLDGEKRRRIDRVTNNRERRLWEMMERERTKKMKAKSR